MRVQANKSFVLRLSILHPLCMIGGKIIVRFGPVYMHYAYMILTKTVTMNIR